ncbi:hypothetical protein [[Mycoplasma] cavipharyngis]|uniref:hypothetical protein n=1 Tax=[Mycoplasma] cavipharyngis TaxID=92757 RepID=UPI00370431E9
MSSCLAILFPWKSKPLLALIKTWVLPGVSKTMLVRLLVSESPVKLNLIWIWSANSFWSST